MGLQSQIPSPVAGGTRPTVPCQDQLKHTLRLVAWRPCCCANWTQPALQYFPVPVCGLLHVVQAVFGRVVECGRVQCA